MSFYVVYKKGFRKQVIKQEEEFKMSKNTFANVLFRYCTWKWNAPSHSF
jgi:hypothetical protein